MTLDGSLRGGLGLHPGMINEGREIQDQEITSKEKSPVVTGTIERNADKTGFPQGVRRARTHRSAGSPTHTTGVSVRGVDFSLG